MKIRFLQTVASENPDLPFQPGQIIQVETPSPYMLSLLDGLQAEILRTDESEQAIELEQEQPEPVRRRGRPRGHD